MSVRSIGAIAVVCALARAAAAQEVIGEDGEIEEVAEAVVDPSVKIHGFVSAGAFVSTDNDYLGDSSNGSIELFEAGVNVTSEPADKLRAGVQLFARHVGDLVDSAPRIDWAFLEYRLRPWAGLRAGIVKMPFGLYNEYSDIDSARTPILMPQSVYSIRNRDVLLSQTGFAAFGNVELGCGARFGELDYQAWFGTLTIPRNALTLLGAELESVRTRYVTGAQAFWTPPVDGLRVGGTYLRAVIDFHIVLDPATLEALIAAGLVPADYDGKLLIQQHPAELIAGSIEYTHGDWMFAAEYMRSLKRQTSSLPMLLPTEHGDSERFYVLATRRLTPQLELGTYLSIAHADVGDRSGEGMQWTQPFHAFQRDLTLTARYDVNEHWLWKVEGHAIDGTADLPAELNPDPKRRWALFLIKTTVTF
jgi:hypothetical protein